MTKLQLDSVASPVGKIHLVVRKRRLVAVDFADCHDRMMRLLEARFGAVEFERSPDPCGFSTKLRAYSGGHLHELNSIAIDPGGTEFQSQVWLALRSVAAGSTASYGDIARAVGHPKAVRAVGAANSRNPIALVIPCHRIIATSGRLSGYAGGLDRKRWLLEHEGAATACLPS